MSRADLERLLGEVAANLPPAAPETERAEAGGEVTWSRGALPFAILSEAGVELRLEPRIAAAAARTPDAAPSGRGPEWVRFNPRSLDPHAVDRLDAWFSLAARLAAEAARPGAPQS